MTVGGLGEHGGQPLAVHSADVRERWCRLTVKGELDLDSASLLRRAIDDAIGRGRNRLSIDAAGVTFIDSAALMVILTARNELIEGGGTLHLTGASAPVARILEIAMLTDLLTDGRGEASFGEGTPPGV